ncbi:uncharacterized protein LOC120355112 [Nilaparvata lugens]|uniref:uncharacterized protein LOC120355112 n=1 Tax=Nilaparvata lugens TaxID=108931 RepID=UPI00193CD59D|nr:uncharacterized protein LOC120355112 [Nilaparvata lugens]
MDSSSSSSFIIPDSPPTEQQLNYWQQQKQQQKARSSPATSAATAAASAVSAGSSSASPLKRQGILVQRERGEEIAIPDSPLPQSTPATWALRRAVLSTQPSKQPVKRRLVFEDEGVLTQSKKRAGMDENSSMLPLMKELRRREEEDEMEFVTIVNAPTPKPWIPLRELKERTPYPIVGVREQTNIHGCCIILKIGNAGSECEVYLPQRFASCIDAGKIQHFNKTCKNYVLLVTHKSANWSDIKIVKQ